MDMDLVLENFDERVSEVESYIGLLQLIDKPGAKVHAEGKRPKQIDTATLKTMKASCFLMLYNLVESSIRSSMEKLYEEMNSAKKTLPEFDSFVKEVWIKQKFRDLDPFSSNQTSYRNLIRAMVEEVLSASCVSLNVDKLHISGNLDAREIRNLFTLHNIPTRTHYRALGGGELKTVKDQRNLLAHGAVSFSDCGQQYSVESIIAIKKQTVVFLRSALRNVKSYIENTSYAA